ncbi:hypothetical protein [Hyalangium gracile]|uniref:hypothetical protein n=1 Tax=Hyalangium gracile TaxID=394092 RepID=UPI001CCF389F|nr:hypothetical protein [Hyalangium gracile]
MKVSARLVLPLAGAAVLAVAVLAVVLWPTPPAPPSPEVPPPPSASVATVTPELRAPAAPSRPPAPRATEPVASASKPAPEASGRATVVPIGPGDDVPLPESPNPLPQVNDPILPEKPQTARWRLGKTERITSLLARDVERLERDRDAAGARGDAAERQRLDTLIQRHQARLKKLREELQQLAREAENEPPELP